MGLVYKAYLTTGEETEIVAIKMSRGELIEQQSLFLKSNVPHTVRIIALVSFMPIYSSQLFYQRWMKGK